MTPNRPQLQQILEISTAHLCAETRDYLSNLSADDWPILGGDTKYGYFVHCPEEIQELPADLWAVIVFAKSHEVKYILFDQDESILADELLDFTSQPDESAIGMDDVRIESGPHTDTAILPGGVRIVFHKARDSHVIGAETEMFRDAWRQLVGRDETGALSPAAIETLERRARDRDASAMHQERGAA